MNKISPLLLCLGVAFFVPALHALDLKQSTITEVINDVEIISAAQQKTTPAAVNDIFSIPDILRTGKDSRAEMIAKDETITRVGAETIFSFDPASRTIDLKQGSLLFHSPHGKGGGTIHTGSATASVLGTTLIVTTTPDGGMKVLDLEGKVEVKFADKKTQKLLPGQMTFILPGGNQLAPVIVFRLDELVQKSLLVHGFGKPLASMPLIQNQIDRQLNLIKSGRASDTGLLVGDTATPNQVEVLDPNSLQSHFQNRHGGVRALQVDAAISTSDLHDPQIPIPPRRIFLDRKFSLAANRFFLGQRFSGFAGRNITFGANGPLDVDLQPFTGQSKFDFVAAGIMDVANSTTFSGLSPLGILSLIGGKGFTCAPGMTLEADLADFRILTAGPLVLDTVSLYNHVGKISLASGSTIDLHNIYILPAGRTTFTAPQAVNIAWDDTGYFGKLSTDDDTLILTDPAKGRVHLTAQNGSLTVTDTSIQAHYLTLNSGDSILLDANGRFLNATGRGATATFVAPNLITVNNTDFGKFASVNMAANTLNLSDVAFAAGSTVTLKSLLGLLNVGSSVPGHVNFIQNVTYGGNPAENYVNNGGGITVTKLH